MKLEFYMAVDKIRRENFLRVNRKEQLVLPREVRTWEIPAVELTEIDEIITSALSELDESTQNLDNGKNARLVKLSDLDKDRSTDGKAGSDSHD